MKNYKKNRFPHALTWVQDSRPDNLTLEMKFYVEYEYQYKHNQFQRPGAKNYDELPPKINHCSTCFSYLLCF